jgi:predicted amidohydrolase YtcJ
MVAHILRYNGSIPDHLFLGALGSWGAALLAPYSDRSDYAGIMRISPRALEKLVDQFWEDGFQTVRSLCSSFLSMC